MEMGFRSYEVFTVSALLVCAPANVVALVCVCACVRVCVFARVCGQFYQDGWATPADSRSKQTLAD